MESVKLENKSLDLRGYEPVIGLEVHAQLLTNSKIFATSSTESGKLPNTQTDPVTLGLPGSLPVLNKKVVEFAIKLGLALNCEIRRESIFARKHYFYPDLPKGYQISQYEKPICEKGFLKIEVPQADGSKREKTIRINRIHLEEDAGKNTHLEGEPYSIVDLNRAGVPLVEIVTEADIGSTEEAVCYLQTLRQILRYLDVCDGNMEDGSMRCDANVSVRPVGQEKFGTKVEIKNINSFKFVDKALQYEIERQIDDVLAGKVIVQETRLFDDKKNSTRSMRSKEQAADYRYFPDPDLLPLVVDSAWIEKVRSTIGMLPVELKNKFQTVYGLDEYTSLVLTEEKLVAQYYESAVGLHNNPQLIANWLSTELFGRLNKESISFDKCPVSPEYLADLVKLIDDGVISGKIAKVVFDEMFVSGSDPKSIVKQKGLVQISDSSEIEGFVDEIISQNQDKVVEFKSGKTKLFGFFVGQVMAKTGGKANPAAVNEILKKKLS